MLNKSTKNMQNLLLELIKQDFKEDEISGDINQIYNLLYVEEIRKLKEKVAAITEQN